MSKLGSGTLTVGGIGTATGIVINSSTLTGGSNGVTVENRLNVANGMVLNGTGSGASLAAASAGTLNLSGGTAGIVDYSGGGTSVSMSNGLLSSTTPARLENLAEAPLTPETEAVEIQVGEQTLTIVQNRTLMNFLEAKGFVFSEPAFDDAGHLLSVKVGRPTVNPVNLTASEQLAVNLTGGSGLAIMTPVERPAPPPVELVPEITLPNIVV